MVKSSEAKNTGGIPYWVDFLPSKIRMLCEAPLTVSAIALDAGINLKAECGGKNTCGKCLVRLNGEKLPPLTEAEKIRLTDQQIARGWRLACRVTLQSNTEVFVPPESLIEEHIISENITDNMPSPLQSEIKLVSITSAVPTLSDQRHDLERVADALAEQHKIIQAGTGLPALRSIRSALRKESAHTWIALRNKNIIGAYATRPSRTVGLAVDVGTTKLACYLVDLTAGVCLAAKGTMNPQVAHGADVMTRLEAAMVDPAMGPLLQEIVVDGINRTAAELCGSLGLVTDQILDLCIVGNPAMHHLLLKLQVRPLALSPFAAACGTPLDVGASELGLETAPGANVHLPPPVAGFVGSDHLAFLLSTGFGQDHKVKLGIDIGTNTEIVLQAGERILSCSAASGPAFEGGRLEYGMRAAPGAIDGVAIEPDGKVRLSVIGDHPPVGICGSGVLDALEEMQRAGVVNRRGRLLEHMPGVHTTGENMPAFLLSQASDGSLDVHISQEDIDQILLAKGAIRAGIDILMAEMDVAPADLDQIIMAGAFGTFLNIQKSMNIGLLPELPLSRVYTVGNAAGTGARMMVASTEARRTAMNLAAVMEHQELATYPEFHKYLAKAMRLPKRV